MIFLNIRHNCLKWDARLVKVCVCVFLIPPLAAQHSIEERAWVDMKSECSLKKSRVLKDSSLSAL